VSITYDLNSPTVSTSNLACSIKTPVSEKIPYVFYLLWQKEMRELPAGVYNLLKSARRQHILFHSLLDKVETSDEHREANLCTMLVGSWYKAVLVSQAKQTEVHDLGVGFTNSLTFSCA